MATVVYDDPNSPMARRRLSLVTLCLFILIVILTAYSSLRLEEPSKQLKRGGVDYEASFESSNRHFLNEEWLPAPKSYNKGRVNKQTLTRYGADLKFNPFHSCSHHSFMLSKKASSISPRTTECPKVFIVGAKKGGTTSLYQYLSKHPDFQGIRLDESKWVGETFYFAQKYNKISLKEYLRQFPKGKMSGDASVDNLLHCKAPTRIFRTCGGGVKIIILLRNPVQRYISNFMMRITRHDTYSNYSNLSSIHDAIQHDIDSLRESLQKHGLEFPRIASEWTKLRCLFDCCVNLLYEGFYYVFVMNWLCNFPKENILFVNSEEMFRNPVPVLQQVMEFIKLKPLDNESLYDITSHIYNKGAKPYLPQHHLSSDDRQKLWYYYSMFNEALLQLLDWNQLDWS